MARRSTLQVVFLLGSLLPYGLGSPALAGVGGIAGAQLTFVEALTDPNGALGLDVADDVVVVSPDGRHVYTVGGNFGGGPDPESGALAVFSRDPSTGALTWVDVLRHGDAGVGQLIAPGEIVISPDGKHLYFDAGSSLTSRRLRLFERDSATGALTARDNPTDCPRSPAPARCHLGPIVLAPDGRHLYKINAVTGPDFSQFARDPNSGLLNYLGLAPNSLPTLYRPSSLAMTASGSHLYTAVLEGSGVVFERDVATGLLDEVQVVQITPNLRDLALPQDGRHVYFAPGCTPCALNAFTRSESDGLLENAFQVVGPATGILAVDPSGLFVYWLSGRDELEVFARNDLTGALTAQEVHSIQPTPRFQNDVTTSPDGANVYALATASSGGVLTVFRTATVVDSDSDGIPDSSDNCVAVFNTDQADADAGTDDDASLPGVQHYGDRCDADLNNDGVVNTADFFGHFSPCLGSSSSVPDCAAADLDGNGTVNTGDFFGFFRPQFGSAPGPGTMDP